MKITEKEGDNNQQDERETKNRGWGSPLSYDSWETMSELTTETEGSEDWDYDTHPHSDDDSLPELDNLELRIVDELTDEAMDKALKQVQVEPSAPPPLLRCLTLPRMTVTLSA